MEDGKEDGTEDGTPAVAMPADVANDPIAVTAGGVMYGVCGYMGIADGRCAPMPHPGAAMANDCMPGATGGVVGVGTNT